MATGDLTASTPAFIEANDEVAIKAEIDGLNLAAVTDLLFVVPLADQHKLAIFKVEIAA